jgi:hypothetical protein
MHIYLGYLALFAGINQKARPQSVGALRRGFKARIDLFFWTWDFAV